METEDIVQNKINFSSTATRYETGESTECSFEEEFYLLEQFVNETQSVFSIFPKPESKANITRIRDMTGGFWELPIFG